jgi:putative colanic acid biosysnthesis UDP-glucose lipid carrier transferase
MGTKTLKRYHMSFNDTNIDIPLRVGGRPLRLFVDVGDIICIVVAGVIAYRLKFHVEQINTTYQLTVLLGGLVFGLVSSNIYHLVRNLSFNDKIIRIWIAWFFSLLFLVCGLFLLKIGTLVSREFIINWYFLGSAAIAFNRIVLFKVLTYFFHLSFTSKNVILIGEGLLAEELLARFGSSNINGYKLKEVLKLKDLDEIDGLLTRSDISEIWVSTSMSEYKSLAKINTLLAKLEKTPFIVRVIPDLMTFKLINHSISYVMGVPMIDITQTRMTALNLFLKWMEDKIIALMLLAVFSPIMLVIAILVKLSSPGPILYKQKRVSWNGKEFGMYKFRSMRVNHESGNLQWGHAQTKPVTAIGAFIRKTNLDELPQIFNVLVGDMSIVGPRPERPEFVHEFKEEIEGYMQKHIMKAGITGLAQVNGLRGDTDLNLRIHYDLEYIQNWSLKLDFKIIIMTAFNFFNSENAY